ncbi:DMT family transporter [Streptomyces sp. T-3]|nr:DMT family transporter [Streptomyces sp. T-3]
MAVLDRAHSSEAVATSKAPTGQVQPASARGLVLAAVATVVWSGSFVAARALGDSVPPIQHAFWRWIIAIVAVAPFAAREAWRQRGLIRRHIRFVLVAALLGITVYNTLVNQAGTSTSAGNMGMIMAASPVLMALYERFTGTRLGARRIAGMLIAFAGVLLLVSKGSLAMDFTAGDLWMIGAALSFASYSAILRRKPAEISGLAFLLWTFVLGTLMLLPAYLVSLSVQGGFEASAETVSPLLYVGVASSAVAFFAWNKAISLIGAARAGVIYYMQPVCVAALSLVILGEEIDLMKIVCMVLILGGVILGAARSTAARSTTE